MTAGTSDAPPTLATDAAPPRQPLPEGRLEELLDGVWSALARAAVDRLSPMHAPALASANQDGTPSVRIVTLRGVDPAARRIWCHADRRSPKVAECAGRRVAWVFYDAAQRLQIRAAGPVTVHVGDAHARAAWEASRPLARRCYLADGGPGAVRLSPGSGLAPELFDGPMTPERVEGGWPNFAVLSCTLDTLDRFDLSIQGHRRCVFHFVDGSWSGRWVVP